MDLWKSLAGMVTIEFTSSAPEQILDVIAANKIPLFRVVQKTELIYQIQIHRRDYNALSDILVRRGDQLKIIRKYGLYWSLKELYHRPIFLAVLLILLLASCFLPTRIFFITVEGNEKIPDQLILSAAENCGIRFSASRKHVRSEKVKNALLAAVPQLQWAGINTTGCTAIISVRERMEEKNTTKNSVSNIVADRDGFILSVTATNGTAHIHTGEAVTKGQLLISGYTDCGICIRAARAEGEILAQTNRKITAIMPDFYDHCGRILKTYHQFSVLIGKKRINLWKDSRIFDACCGRMYEEHYVSLPGGYQLPFAFAVDHYFDYEQYEARLSETAAQQQLYQFSENYLIRQMVAGQIISKDQHFSHSDGVYCLKSDYTCTEMIGKEQREQIGVINGKRD